MRKRLLSAAIVVAGQWGTLAHAQMGDELASQSLEDLMDVEIVSATRSVSKLKESPVPMSVIQAEEIENSGLDTIPAVLARLGGVNTMNVGASQQEVSIRGKNITFNRRLLVMIDGRTEYNDLFGVTLWSAFPITMDQIKRIEVVRGPASALFGANAFSGVVNIITKKPDGDGDNLVRAQGGTDSRGLGNFLVNGQKGDELSYQVAGEVQNIGNDDTDVTFKGFDGIPTTANFDDDSESLDTMKRVNASARWQPNDDLTVDFSTGVVDGGLELLLQPGLPRADWDILKNNVKTSLKYFTSDSNHFKFDAYANRFDYETRLAPSTEAVNNVGLPGGAEGDNRNGNFFFPSIEGGGQFDGEVETYNVSGQFVSKLLNDQLQVVTGGEFRRIRNEGGFVEDASKDITSVFANFTYKFADDRFLIGGGYRVDDDSIVGSNDGYTATFAFFPNEKHSIRATARKAFRSPSLFEQFSDVLLNVPNQSQRVQFAGNVEAEVEEITSYDITYSAQIRQFKLELEYWREDYEALIGNPDSGVLDEIDFDPDQNRFTTTTTFRNLSDSESQGVLAGLKWVATEKLTFDFNYAFTDPDELNSLTGETFFSPEHKFNVGANWNVGNWNLNANTRYVGETDDSEFQEGDIAPDGENFTRRNQESYTVVDLKVGYNPPMAEGLELFAMANNLLDDERVEFHEFDAVLKGSGEEFGREIWGGVKWDF